MEVDWEDKRTQARYEDMVSTLVKRIHPAVQRIDGAGGDGGCDLRLHGPDGTTIYELKSFTGRLSQGGRKRQIQRSLQKAAENRPDAWRLVVPIDPTPSEEQWFAELTDKYPFPCQWCGLTWLRAEISQRPEIPRYFLDGYEAKVLQMLRELKAEAAGTEDSHMALSQITSIQHRLNESDPHFRYEFSTWSKDSSYIDGSIMTVRTSDGRIDVVPRYATALEDRPVSFHAQIRSEGADGSAVSMIEEAIDYGESITLTPDILEQVSIDAPGGLSNELRNATLEMVPLEEALQSPMLLHATIVAGADSRALGTHEFSIRMRRSGRKGAVLFGADVTGLIDIEIRFRTDDMTLNISLEFNYKEVLPGVARRAAEWLEKFRPPNLICLDVGSPLRRVGHSEIKEPAIAEGVSDVFRSFEKVQDRAGVAFSVPTDLSNEESKLVLLAGQWLSDEKVQFTWKRMRFTCDSVDEILSLVPESGSVTLLLAQHTEIEFRGRSLPLGYRARKIQARLANAEELQRAIERDDPEKPIELRSGDSDVGWEWILPRKDEPGFQSSEG